ncbi:PREDICTED: classical arabinogalactan protein 9-like [Branchiostoma belcheri]|uniref:Classical arabinogalactan protein 9-like n=1 Tax=Branchiostoma belcheri TaxID=7741 RepID=A0A6P4YW88_BRABE|nr:PREDICTED: classical arabinogalactan protein 9-like [Branchiostoma belcheri]
MPGCCGGPEGQSPQRRRRRWVLVAALTLIVLGCAVCVVTVSVSVSNGQRMRFPYEGMGLLAIGVGMMVVHSNCGVQKIQRRPRMEISVSALPVTREPQRPLDAPPAYWTVFSLFRDPNESPESAVPPPTSVDPASLPGGTAQLPVAVVVNEQSTPPPLPLPPPAVLDVSALTLPMTLHTDQSQLPSSPPPSYPASRCDPDEQNGGREDFSDTDSLPPEYDDITDNTDNTESVTTRL